MAASAAAAVAPVRPSRVGVATSVALGPTVTTTRPTTRSLSSAVGSITTTAQGKGHGRSVTTYVAAPRAGGMPTMATSSLMRATTSRMVVATPGTTVTTPGTSLGTREEHGANMGLNYQQLRHWSLDRFCGRTYSRTFQTVTHRHDPRVAEDLKVAKSHDLCFAYAT